jgi:hypothetical protein
MEMDKNELWYFVNLVTILFMTFVMFLLQMFENSVAWKWGLVNIDFLFDKGGVFICYMLWIS